MLEDPKKPAEDVGSLKLWRDCTAGAGASFSRPSCVVHRVLVGCVEEVWFLPPHPSLGYVEYAGGVGSSVEKQGHHGPLCQASLEGEEISGI